MPVTRDSAGKLQDLNECITIHGLIQDCKVCITYVKNSKEYQKCVND